jgi:hypothetical protein
MVEVVQEHLGRTSVQVTLDTHSHIWPEDEDRTLISENSCPAPRSLGDDSSGRIVTPPQDLFFLRCAGRFERLCLPSASIDRIRGEGGANGSTLLGGRSSPRPLHRLHWPDTYRAGPDPTRPPCVRQQSPRRVHRRMPTQSRANPAVDGSRQRMPAGGRSQACSTHPDGSPLGEGKHDKGHETPNVRPVIGNVSDPLV